MTLRAASYMKWGMEEFLPTLVRGGAALGATTVVV
jgi:hypothetical protein